MNNWGWKYKNLLKLVASIPARCHPFCLKPFSVLITEPNASCLSQASWLEQISEKDLKNFEDPTGKVQTHIFSVKYNVSVAATKFKPSKK